MAKYEVGQQVAIDSGWYRGYKLGTIERVTPGGQTLVRVGTRVLRFGANGKEVNGGSRPGRLVEATPDILAAVRRNELVARLEYVKWKDIPLDTLERVVAALDGPPVQL